MGAYVVGAAGAPGEGTESENDGAWTKPLVRDLSDAELVQEQGIRITLP